ncbi:MAG: hypothetical protein WC843_06500 [Candidatus Gracilibacteria bacterium]|jgi:hypothetical protein
MKKLLKNKKVQIASMFSTVAIAGIILFQGAIPKAESMVKISSISPNQGATGTEVVISGSGFSSSIQGITGTQINGKVYAPGNYILIQSEVLDQPILSPDGKTLTFNVNLISDKVKADCSASLAKIKPGSCKIQIKVVNAYGKMSLGQYFTVTSMPSVPTTPSCLFSVSVAPTTPAAQNISPGQSGVTLTKFNATPNCDGTLNSFAVSLLPMPNGYQNISTLRLYDDVTGVQLGTTQNVTTAGMNFPYVNIQLIANQTLVLRVVADVSPSALIGSTVYGVYGGSLQFNVSGELMVNNGSGQLFAGNIMTVAATQYTAPGTNPRIMYWWGKVNQHTDANGNWLTDSDGVSGADLDKLTYCKKFYQNTFGVEDYILETTDTWRDRGNVGGPYTSTKISTKCLQPS